MVKDEFTRITNEKINFKYKTNETKYYLLTRGSGYPLAEFTCSNLPESTATRLVIPENMPKTVDMVPENDTIV